MSNLRGVLSLALFVRCNLATPDPNLIQSMPRLVIFHKVESTPLVYMDHVGARNLS